LYDLVSHRNWIVHRHSIDTENACGRAGASDYEGLEKLAAGRCHCVSESQLHALQVERIADDVLVGIQAVSVGERWEAYGVLIEKLRAADVLYTSVMLQSRQMRGLRALPGCQIERNDLPGLFSVQSGPGMGKDHLPTAGTEGQGRSRNARDAKTGYTRRERLAARWREATETTAVGVHNKDTFLLGLQKFPKNREVIRDL